MSDVVKNKSKGLKYNEGLTEDNKWKNLTIGDLCESVVSGGTPRTSIKEYYLNGNIPWLKTKEVNQGRIYSTENKITQLGLDNSSAKLIPPNSVTIAMYGDGQTAGRVGLTKIPLTTNQACCNLIIDKEIAVPEYVFYNLLGSYDELVARKTGSGQQNLSSQLIKAFEILLPPLLEQKAIATILSSLDDKIDLLHRQNKTLEAMAETLFRQWFVEEAGADWEEGTLEDVSTNIRNSVKSSEIIPTSRYIGLEHIDRRNIALCQYGIGDDVSSNKYAFEVNDILFGKLRPYFHKVCYAQFSGICSTDILVIRPKKPELFVYCLFAFFQNDVVEYANLGSGGTRMPRTEWESLKKYQIKIPDITSINNFNKIVLPLIQKITYNLTQIKTLVGIRDSILPKLMSGEVRVVGKFYA